MRQVSGVSRSVSVCLRSRHRGHMARSVGVTYSSCARPNNFESRRGIVCIMPLVSECQHLSRDASYCNERSFEDRVTAVGVTFYV
jgi:hypothetical protein